MAAHLDNAFETANRLIGGIYEAALETAKWEQVLRELTDELDCVSAIFRVLDPLEPSVDFAISVGYTEESLKAYADYFVNLDPFVKALNSKPVGHISVGQEAISDRDFSKSEYYNDCFRPYGRFHVAGGYIVREQGRVMLFGVQRERRAGAFEADDMQLLNLLIPHIARSFKISHHIRRSGVQDSALAKTMDLLSSAIVLIDGRLKVHFANQAATRLIHQTKGVAIVKNRLTFTESSTARDIREHLKPEPGIRSSFNETVLAQRSGGLRLVVAPLPSELPNWPMGEERAEAILILARPDEEILLPNRVLKDLYGLTPAESRLVEQLARGESMDAIRNRFSLTKNTVKSQLKAVFRKTGARSQADLLRLLLSGPEAAILHAGYDRLRRRPNPSLTPV